MWKVCEREMNNKEDWLSGKHVFQISHIFSQHNTHVIHNFCGRYVEKAATNVCHFVHIEVAIFTGN